VDKPRVFILDDERDMTALTSTMLGFNGFDVVTENDPHEGVRHLLETDTDILLMDLMMPGLDGFSILTKLRNSERHATTPIVIFSAKRVSDEERRMLIDHKVRFLTKPLSPGDLVQAVKEELAGNSGSASA